MNRTRQPIALEVMGRPFLRKRSLSMKFLIIPLILASSFSSFAQTAKPVFRADYHEPTGDKPQSKLWHTRGHWWALLPNKKGLSLWERSDAGWKEHPEATSALAGIVGRCDVWPEVDTVTAVGTDGKTIHVFRMVYSNRWEGKPLATLSLPTGKEGTMTATIACDGEDCWWIAADVGGSIYVWNSKDATTWSEPMLLGDSIQEKEDLCLATRLPGGIGVIWSDQPHDRVVIREHADGAAPDKWKPEEVIEEGSRTADNHLRASLSPDGTLWVATKNSVDQQGKPQLVLRVRSATGEWRNLPYAPREPGLLPTRPAVFTTHDPKVVLLGHPVYNMADRTQSYVEFGLAAIDAPEVLRETRTVILPEKELKANDVWNVTGPKFPFPADAPWIILAADKKGGIYEVDLKSLLQNRHQSE